MSNKTAEIILEWLKVQKRIEFARFTGFTTDPDNQAPEWAKESQSHVIQEIRNQITVLEDYIK
jgi:hypothetical protein